MESDESARTMSMLIDNDTTKFVWSLGITFKFHPKATAFHFIWDNGIVFETSERGTVHCEVQEDERITPKSETESYIFDVLEA